MFFNLFLLYSAIPKPVINEKRLQVNGNKATQEISAQHEAMIHYIHSSKCLSGSLPIL